MTVFRSVFLMLILTIASFCASGQVNDQKIRQVVLHAAIKDSTFIFGKWTEKSGTETHLKYMGQVTTRHGQKFKIINSIWFWGLSHRATSRILIFNGSNHYVGNYYVTVTSDLPTKLEKGRLIFKNVNEDDCDKKLASIVNLKNGLPKQFFRKCQGKYGDIYTFDGG